MVLGYSRSQKEEILLAAALKQLHIMVWMLVHQQLRWDFTRLYYHPGWSVHVIVILKPNPEPLVIDGTGTLLVKLLPHNRNLGCCLCGVFLTCSRFLPHPKDMQISGLVGC